MGITVHAGMNINQLLTMLMAQQAQGATEVRIIMMDAEGNGKQTGVDWVAPKPIDGVAYLCPMQDWEEASNEGMQALDM